MKKNFLLIAGFFRVFSLFAADVTLAAIDDCISFRGKDLSAEYHIETRSPDGGVSSKNVAMFRRDANDEYVILILRPEVDKGKGYLKQGEILWLYEPKNGSFTFTSAQERFQNTAVRNSDFNSSNYARDYKIVKKSSEKLGKFGDCAVLELEATTKNVSFPKIKMWVSNDNLIRKREDYSLSGQLLRTIAIPSYQKVEAKWVPVSMTILDHLMKRTVNQKTVFERTVVTISKPSLKPLPDDVYTKEYLQRVR